MPEIRDCSFGASDRIAMEPRPTTQNKTQQVQLRKQERFRIINLIVIIIIISHRLPPIIARHTFSIFH
jgi:hypothetical protein